MCNIACDIMNDKIECLEGCRLRSNIWCRLLIKIIKRKETLQIMTGKDIRSNVMNKGYGCQIYLGICIGFS